MHRTCVWLPEGVSQIGKVAAHPLGAGIAFTKIHCIPVDGGNVKAPTTSCTNHWGLKMWYFMVSHGIPCYPIRLS